MGNSTKTGRVLSGASRQRITAAIEALRELLEQADLREQPEDAGAPPEDKSVVREQLQSSLAAIKSLGGDRIGGYAVLWGNPQRRDVVGEFFTPETEELDGLFKALGRLPWLYQHGMDANVKTSVAGIVDVMRADEIGLWYEAQLDLANQYKDAIRKLVARGVLGSSSGTLPAARKVAQDGRILRWPIAEISGTPTPAEPRMLERPLADVKAAYAALGLDLSLLEGNGAATGEAARSMALEQERELVRLLQMTC